MSFKRTTLVVGALVLTAGIVAISVAAPSGRPQQARANPLYNYIAVVDYFYGGGTGRHPSVQLATSASHSPVISYYRPGGLWVVRCASHTYCTGFNSYSNPSSGGFYTSLALDASFNAVVAHYQGGDLGVVHCGNPTCSTASSVAVDTTGTVGEYPSLVLDGAGNPVVSYFDVTNQDLKLVHCGDLSCSSGNTIVTLDTGPVGRRSSLQLDGSGNPVVAYCAMAAGQCVALKLVHCGDPLCSAGNTYATPDTGTNLGDQPLLELDAAGNPVIAYRDGPAQNLVHCSDPSCTGPTSIEVIASLDGGADLELDSAGRPVMADVGYPVFDVTVVRCGDSNCSSGNSSVVVDSLLLGGFGISLALDSADIPVVAYHDFYYDRLKLLTCSTPTCAKVFPTPAPTSTWTPSLTPTHTNTPGPSATPTPTPPAVGGVALEPPASSGTHYNQRLLWLLLVPAALSAVAASRAIGARHR